MLEMGDSPSHVESTTDSSDEFLPSRQTVAKRRHVCRPLSGSQDRCEGAKRRCHRSNRRHAAADPEELPPGTSLQSGATHRGRHSQVNAAPTRRCQTNTQSGLSDAGMSTLSALLRNRLPNSSEAVAVQSTGQSASGQYTSQDSQVSQSDQLDTQDSFLPSPRGQSLRVRRRRTPVVAETSNGGDQVSLTRRQRQRQRRAKKELRNPSQPPQLPSETVRSDAGPAAELRPEDDSSGQPVALPDFLNEIDVEISSLQRMLVLPRQETAPLHQQGSETALEADSTTDGSGQRQRRVPSPAYLSAFRDLLRDDEADFTAARSPGMRLPRYNPSGPLIPFHRRQDESDIEMGRFQDRLMNRLEMPAAATSWRNLMPTLERTAPVRSVDRPSNGQASNPEPCSGSRAAAEQTRRPPSPADIPGPRSSGSVNAFSLDSLLNFSTQSLPRVGENRTESQGSVSEQMASSTDSNLRAPFRTEGPRPGAEVDVPPILTRNLSPLSPLLDRLEFNGIGFGSSPVVDLDDYLGRLDRGMPEALPGASGASQGSDGAGRHAPLNRMPPWWRDVSLERERDIVTVHNSSSESESESPLPPVELPLRHSPRAHSRNGVDLNRNESGSLPELFLGSGMNDSVVQQVQQYENDEDLARRLQEEADRELALSLSRNIDQLREDASQILNAMEAMVSTNEARGRTSRVAPTRGTPAAPGAATEPGASADPDSSAQERLDQLRSLRERRRQMNERLQQNQTDRGILTSPILLRLSPGSRQLVLRFHNARRQGQAGGFDAFPDSFDRIHDYELLLELTAEMGEVKPRGATMAEIGLIPEMKYQTWRESSQSQSMGFEKDECIICMVELEDSHDLRVLHCTHYFHKGCIDKWLVSCATCPVCREDVRYHK